MMGRTAMGNETVPVTGRKAKSCWKVSRKAVLASNGQELRIEAPSGIALAFEVGGDTDAMSVLRL
jgi:hypothetical protein